MQSEATIELAEKISQEARSLTAAPDGVIPEALPLVRIQNLVEGYHPPSDNLDLIFLSFFLHGFLDDVFYNLTGDIPYSPETDAARGAIFKSLAMMLIRLTEYIKNEDYPHCYSVYCDLTKRYLDGIVTMERLMEPKIA